MTPADTISHPTQITLLDVMFWDMKVGSLVATQNGYKKQICTASLPQPLPHLPQQIKIPQRYI